MKIPAAARIRQYEVTYILPASYTSDEAGKVHSKIADTIAKLKGKIVSQEDWGKLNFAYKIKHVGKNYFEGVYTHVVIELDRKQTPVFERELMLNQQLLRYLVVIAEPAPTMPVRKAARPIEELE